VVARINPRRDPPLQHDAINNESQQENLRRKNSRSPEETQESPAVLATWAFNALVQVVWRPHAVARQLRAQGVCGLGYRFFSGSLSEMRRLRAGAAGTTLDAGDHNFIPVVYPHHNKWISQYGTLTHRVLQKTCCSDTCSAPLFLRGGERLQPCRNWSLG
jgi:hypothetical protein